MKKCLFILFAVLILCIAVSASADSTISLPSALIVPPTYDDATAGEMLTNFETDDWGETKLLVCRFEDCSINLYYDYSSKTGEYLFGGTEIMWGKEDTAGNYTRYILSSGDRSQLNGSTACYLSKPGAGALLGETGDFEIIWDIQGNVDSIQYVPDTEDEEFHIYTWDEEKKSWYYSKYDYDTKKTNRFYVDLGFTGSEDLVPYCAVSFTGENLVLWKEKSAGGFTGLACDPDGIWRYYADGVVQTGYSGLYYDQNLGWWLVQNGAIDFNYTGLYCDQTYGWWLIGGGQICWDYTGLWGDPNYGWWLIGGGQICRDYTGLWYDQNYGWWLINGGTIAWDYTGNWDDPNFGTWYISGGCLAGPAQTSLNGLNCDADGVWRLYDNGTFASGFTGLYYDQNVGWWLIRNGEIAWDYTGLWCDPQYGWWLIGGGHLCDDYNGLWNDPVCGWWLISNGTIDWGYTGTVEEFGGTWNIVNGQLIF